MRDSGPPLATRRLRDLDLVRNGSREPAFLHAASGLTASGGDLYVIADDELQLARFPAAGDAPGTLLGLLPGKLPDEHDARKREKADFEILLRLPALPRYPSGALLALGSGSRPNRERGALLALDACGRAQGDAVPINASPLFQRLGAMLGPPNLEGGWLHGSSLRLLQRGHQGAGRNVVIELDFSLLADALAHEQVLTDVAPGRVHEMPLGAVEGVGLTFTDACGLPDGSWLYSAVAEDTSDSYADGAFVAAVLGLVSADGRVLWQRMLAPDSKVEGILGEATGVDLRVLCVTDADDRLTPAQLLEVRIRQ
jgi:hypothetical protein